MKSIFRATAILSGSSVISILLSLASAKVMALYLHPDGYGYYGLLQSFVGLAGLVTGMGIATGMVRMGARAVTGSDGMTISALRSGAWLLFSALACVALGALAVFREAIARLAFGMPGRGGVTLWMGIALVFTVAGSLQCGTLNAYHQVGALAKYGVTNTILSTLFSITAVLLWGVRGVVPAVIGGAVVGWLASAYFLRSEVGALPAQPDKRAILKAAGSLLRFGFPYTASMLIGTGVQLALPMVVLHLLSRESVGYYRAAAAISVGYLGFLVTAMGQDYYPRLSAACDRPQAMISIINDQHRLIMIIGVPLILATLALVPILIPVIYSPKFSPAVDILEWQLLGDIFKFSSWTMSFAILARCSSLTYFLTELVGGITTLLTTWLAVRWFGLSGLGISFLITYVVYYAVVWCVIRRDIQLVWSATNKKMMLGSLAAALFIRVLPSTRFAYLRTPAALALALAAGIYSLIFVWRTFMHESLGENVVSDGQKSTAATIPGV
ncbi:MAG: oligosaccharide flippase family protein [Terriglobales bacterium]|jgi:PST family polysaccharide transporter